MENIFIIFTVLSAEDPLEVHIQVNVALRGKLVEEIKDNTVKVQVLSEGLKFSIFDSLVPSSKTHT